VRSSAERRPPARDAVRVGAYYRDAVRRLRRARLAYGHGLHDARDEAAYLILHGLNLPLESIAAYSDRVLGAKERRRIDALLARRIAARVPAAYLTGEAWLGDLRFSVDPRVIIPRSFIAELLRERLAPWLRAPVRSVLDLCTGSGCLAIAAAHAFPRARIDAADVSRPALALARKNVKSHRLGSRVRVLHSDLFSALAGRRYDLIVCNPPYVTAAAMRRLPPEYRREPRIALAGGRDGLDVVRRLIGEAAAHLAPRGLLVCEIGGNRRTLERAYPKLPFLWPEVSAGADRVFVLERDELPGARR